MCRHTGLTRPCFFDASLTSFWPQFEILVLLLLSLCFLSVTVFLRLKFLQLSPEFLPESRTKAIQTSGLSVSLCVCVFVFHIALSLSLLWLCNWLLRFLSISVSVDSVSPSCYVASLALSFVSLSIPSSPLSLSLVFSVTRSSHCPSLPFQPVTHNSKGFVSERRSLTPNGTHSLSLCLSLSVHTQPRAVFLGRHATTDFFKCHVWMHWSSQMKFHPP